MSKTITVKSLRELDAEVAKARGWTDIDLTTEWGLWEYGDPGDEFCDPGVGTGIQLGFDGKWPFPRYTTNANAAMELEEGFPGRVVMEEVSAPPLVWRVTCHCPGAKYRDQHESRLVAVCLAYVKAKTGRRVVLEEGVASR